ncbi:MAG: lysoplasmalogenase [bacterium]|nr:lysoplasmalogenase [bacterium]
MTSGIVVAVVALGSAHLAAYYAPQKALAGALKAVPILLLAWTVASAGDVVAPGYGRLIALGLVASAIGDLCLVSERGFVAGLSSFLVAHVLYLLAFLPAGAGLAWPVAVGLALFVAIFLGRLLTHVPAALRAPVVVYVAVIAAMAWAAARRAGTPATPEPSALLALAGAFAFMTSDAILAWDRFVRRLPFGHGWVMVTYYGAQVLIAASASVAPR